MPFYVFYNLLQSHLAIVFNTLQGQILHILDNIGKMLYQCYAGIQLLYVWH